MLVLFPKMYIFSKKMQNDDIIIYMKRIYILIFMILLFVPESFAYNIAKDFDGVLWEYEIVATNESLYSTNEEGEKEFSHTLLIRDSKSKINYTIYCASESDTLKAYYDYINQYKTSSDIRDKLIPELQKKVKNYSASDSGTWMFCYVDEYINTYYSDIPNDVFENILYKKLKSDYFDKEDLVYFIYNLFDDEAEFWQIIFGSDEKFEDQYDLFKYLVTDILDECETDDNKERISNLRKEFAAILEESQARDSD